MHVWVLSDNPAEVVGEPMFLKDNQYQYDRTAASQYGSVFRKTFIRSSVFTVATVFGNRGWLLRVLVVRIHVSWREMYVVPLASKLQLNHEKTNRESEAVYDSYHYLVSSELQSAD